MINLSHFNRQFNGVVHVGAHDLQELEYYKSLGIKNRMWVDGNRKTTKEGELIIGAYIGDGKPYHVVYIASNNGESTSLLKPLLHLEKYPEIKFMRKYIDEEVQTYRLDQVGFGDQLKEGHDFDLLVLDIQGMEYSTLKAMDKYATYFDCIVTEAYLEELYEGCGYLHEIDVLLEGRGYERVAFEEEQGKGWGNAYYQKK